MDEPIIIKPQKGPQTRCLQSSADIIIFGGAAGGGKTWAELAYPLRYIETKGFGCVIFRKNSNQITNEGGLWDNARDMYSGIVGAEVRKGDVAWVFHGDDGEPLSRISFRHIERDEEVYNFQGSQICGIEFDELTHFSRFVFFYMLSRNRSMCGVRPYVLATCNPDVDSWVAEFISWWIDPDTGYAIPERSGVIRWMIRRNDIIYWADKKQDLIDRFELKTEEELQEPRSVTFIASSVYDNKELLKVNPQYLANLKALPEVERERLLHGNWKIKPAGGLYFKRSQVQIIPEMPNDIVFCVRGWDFASTEKTEGNDPDFTSGVLIGKRKSGKYVVLDVINQRISAGDVEKLLVNTSMSDRAKYGRLYRVRIPIDPGAAGKIVADTYVKKLAGFAVKTERVTGSKILRATPFATQWQNGNVEVVAAEWNDMYLAQLEFFPDSKHDDMVDASADAFVEVAEPKFSVKNLI